MGLPYHYHYHAMHLVSAIVFVSMVILFCEDTLLTNPIVNMNAIEYCFI